MKCGGVLPPDGQLLPRPRRAAGPPPRARHRHPGPDRLAAAPIVLDFPLFFGATLSFLAFYVSSQREIGRTGEPTLRCLPLLLSLGHRHVRQQRRAPCSKAPFGRSHRVHADAQVPHRGDGGRLAVQEVPRGPQPFAGRGGRAGRLLPGSRCLRRRAAGTGSACRSSWSSSTASPTPPFCPPIRGGSPARFGSGPRRDTRPSASRRSSSRSRENRRARGLPCAFVRLTGCALRCVWCDTAYAFHGGDEMTVDEAAGARPRPRHGPRRGHRRRAARAGRRLSADGPAPGSGQDGAARNGRPRPARPRRPAGRQDRGRQGAGQRHGARRTCPRTSSAWRRTTS